MIIGLSGYARVGKDTAAEALMKRGFVRVAFADALKSDVVNALCDSIGEVNGPDINVPELVTRSCKETFRPLLVEYGRAMRSLQPG